MRFHILGPDGLVNNVILWDGKTPIDVPPGHAIVREDVNRRWSVDTAGRGVPVEDKVSSLEDRLAKLEGKSTAELLADSVKVTGVDVIRQGL